MHGNRATALLAAAALVGLAAAPAMAQVKVTTSNGDVMVYTQKNLVDHMIVGDSVELEMAQLAAMRTQNTAVKDFANMLVADHRAHLDALRKLADKHDIGRQALAADTASAGAIRALADLRSMSTADSAFDQAFVRDQIEHHKQEIISLKMFGGAAKDDDLKEDIQHTRPVLERHLARAREVAAHLGMPADTSGAPGATSTVTKKPND